MPVRARKKIGQARRLRVCAEKSKKKEGFHRRYAGERLRRALVGSASLMRDWSRGTPASRMSAKEKLRLRIERPVYRRGCSSG
jgi:hypothetical protein